MDCTTLTIPVSPNVQLATMATTVNAYSAHHRYPHVQAPSPSRPPLLFKIINRSLLLNLISRQ